MGSQKRSRAVNGGYQSGEERTAIELFVAGVRGWDTELRQLLDPSADGK
jgi:hypothetical protein